MFFYATIIKQKLSTTLHTVSLLRKTEYYNLRAKLIYNIDLQQQIKRIIVKQPTRNY